MEQHFAKLVETWLATGKKVNQHLKYVEEYLDSWDMSDWSAVVDLFDGFVRDFAAAADEFRRAADQVKPVGRPRKPIFMTAVRSELEEGLSVAALARKLGVSRQTVYRRLKAAKAKESSLKAETVEEKTVVEKVKEPKPVKKVEEPQQTPQTEEHQDKDWREKLLIKARAAAGSKEPQPVSRIPDEDDEVITSDYR